MFAYKHTWLKPVAIFTAAIFSFTTVAWSAPAGSSVILNAVKDPSEILRPFGTQNDRSLDGIQLDALSQQIEIPSDLGQIQTRYTSPVILSKAKDPAQGFFGTTSLRMTEIPSTIIHIQDAHAHFEAQENIQGLLEHIQKEYGVDAIFLEGATEEVTTERLSFFKSPELSYKLAQQLTRDGIMGGAELHMLNGDRSKDLSPSRVRIYGIEDEQLYSTNLEQFRAVYSEKQITDEYLTSLKSQIVTKSSNVFNKKLMKFFKEWMFYQDVPEQLMRQLKTLKSAANEEIEINLDHAHSQMDWPQLYRIFRIEALESERDVAQAKEELPKLEAWVAAIRHPERPKGVKDLSLDSSHPADAQNDGGNEFFQILRTFVPINDTAKYSPRQLVENFYDQVKEDGFSFGDYPYLSKEWGYKILKSEIETQDLFVEIQTLTDSILNQLADSSEAKELIEQYKNYLLLEKLFSLELTFEEHQKVLAKGKIMLLPTASESMRNLFVKALEFYAGARARETAMIEKMTAVMQEKKITKAALVTGGFHAEGLQSEFKNQQLSFVEVTPHISEVEGNDTYVEAMLQDGDYLSLRSYITAEGPRHAVTNAIFSMITRAAVETFTGDLVSFANQYGNVPHGIRAELRETEDGKQEVRISHDGTTKRILDTNNQLSEAGPSGADQADDAFVVKQQLSNDWEEGDLSGAHQGADEFIVTTPSRRLAIYRIAAVVSLGAIIGLIGFTMHTLKRVPSNERLKEFNEAVEQNLFQERYNFDPKRTGLSRLYRSIIGGDNHFIQNPEMSRSTPFQTGLNDQMKRYEENPDLLSKHLKQAQLFYERVSEKEIPEFTVESLSTNPEVKGMFTSWIVRQIEWQDQQRNEVRDFKPFSYLSSGYFISLATGGFVLGVAYAQSHYSNWVTAGMLLVAYAGLALTTAQIVRDSLRAELPWNSFKERSEMRSVKTVLARVTAAAAMFLATADNNTKAAELHPDTNGTVPNMLSAQQDIFNVPMFSLQPNAVKAGPGGARFVIETDISGTSGGGMYNLQIPVTGDMTFQVEKVTGPGGVSADHKGIIEVKQGSNVYKRTLQGFPRSVSEIVTYTIPQSELTLAGITQIDTIALISEDFSGQSDFIAGLRVRKQRQILSRIGTPLFIGSTSSFESDGAVVSLGNSTAVIDTALERLTGVGTTDGPDDYWGTGVVGLTANIDPADEFVVVALRGTGAIGESLQVEMGTANNHATFHIVDVPSTYSGYQLPVEVFTANGIQPQDITQALVLAREAAGASGAGELGMALSPLLHSDVTTAYILEQTQNVVTWGPNAFNVDLSGTTYGIFANPLTQMGTAFQVQPAVNASGQRLRVKYLLNADINGVKVEFKKKTGGQLQTAATGWVNFKATTGSSKEVYVDLPVDVNLNSIDEIVFSTENGNDRNTGLIIRDMDFAPRFEVRAREPKKLRFESLEQRQMLAGDGFTFDEIGQPAEQQNIQISDEMAGEIAMVALKPVSASAPTSGDFTIDDLIARVTETLASEGIRNRTVREVELAGDSGYFAVSAYLAFTSSPRTQLFVANAAGEDVLRLDSYNAEDDVNVAGVAATGHIIVQTSSVRGDFNGNHIGRIRVYSPDKTKSTEDRILYDATTLRRVSLQDLPGSHYQYTTQAGRITVTEFVWIPGLGRSVPQQRTVDAESGVIVLDLQPNQVTVVVPEDPAATTVEEKAVIAPGNDGAFTLLVTRTKDVVDVDMRINFDTPGVFDLYERPNNGSVRVDDVVINPTQHFGVFSITTTGDQMETIIFDWRKVRNGESDFIVTRFAGEPVEITENLPGAVGNYLWTGAGGGTFFHTTTDGVNLTHGNLVDTITGSILVTSIAAQNPTTAEVIDLSTITETREEFTFAANGKQTSYDRATGVLSVDDSTSPKKKAVARTLIWNMAATEEDPSVGSSAVSVIELGPDWLKQLRPAGFASVIELLQGKKRSEVRMDRRGFLTLAAAMGLTVLPNTADARRPWRKKKPAPKKPAPTQPAPEVPSEPAPVTSGTELIQGDWKAPKKDNLILWRDTETGALNLSTLADGVRHSMWLLSGPQNDFSTAREIQLEVRSTATGTFNFAVTSGTTLVNRETINATTDWQTISIPVESTTPLQTISLTGSITNAPQTLEFRKITAGRSEVRDTPPVYFEPEDEKGAEVLNRNEVRYLTDLMNTLLLASGAETVLTFTSSLDYTGATASAIIHTNDEVAERSVDTAYKATAPDVYQALVFMSADRIVAEDSTQDIADAVTQVDTSAAILAPIVNEKLQDAGGPVVISTTDELTTPAVASLIALNAYNMLGPDSKTELIFVDPSGAMRNAILARDNEYLTTEQKNVVGQTITIARAHLDTEATLERAVTQYQDTSVISQASIVQTESLGVVSEQIVSVADGESSHDLTSIQIAQAVIVKAIATRAAANKVAIDAPRFAKDAVYRSEVRLLIAQALKQVLPEAANQIAVNARGMIVLTLSAINTQIQAWKATAISA